MLSRGLLLCSFFIKKKYAHSDDGAIGLNQSYEYDEIVYQNFFELFQGFIDNYSELTNDEKMMKMFAILKNSSVFVQKDGYSILSGVVCSGAYGTEGDITDKDTKKVVYKRSKNDADIKNFNYMIYIPSDYNGVSVVKGIVIFETIGNYGVKTITTQNMKRFFSEKYGLTLETRSISIRLLLEKLFKEDRLNRISFVKNSVSKDMSDNMFYNVGREEKVYFKPRMRTDLIRLLLEKIDGVDNNEVYEIENEEYDDIKMTFSHLGRTKTVKLKTIDRFSLIEDIPEEMYPVNANDRGRLIEYMEKTARQYAEKMIFIS